MIHYGLQESEYANDEDIAKLISLGYTDEMAR